MSLDFAPIDSLKICAFFRPFKRANIVHASSTGQSRLTFVFHILLSNGVKKPETLPRIAPMPVAHMIVPHGDQPNVPHRASTKILQIRFPLLRYTVLRRCLQRRNKAARNLPLVHNTLPVSFHVRARTQKLHSIRSMNTTTTSRATSMHPPCFRFFFPLQRRSCCMTTAWT